MFSTWFNWDGPITPRWIFKPHSYIRTCVCLFRDMFLSLLHPFRFASPPAGVRASSPPPSRSQPHQDLCPRHPSPGGNRSVLRRRSGTDAKRKKGEECTNLLAKLLRWLFRFYKEKSNMAATLLRLPHQHLLPLCSGFLGAFCLCKCRWRGGLWWGGSPEPAAPVVWM